MLFRLRKTLNLNVYPNIQKVLYDALKTEYENSIVTTENNRIQIHNKGKFGLYFNSFVPDISIEFLECGKKISVEFSLCKTTKILFYLIWLVSFFIGIISVLNDGNIIFEIFMFLICIIISCIFGYVGLYLSSIKHMKILKKRLGDSLSDEQ